MKKEFNLPCYKLIFIGCIIIGITVLAIPMVRASKLIDYGVSGLSLNIGGTLVLVFFGFPQPDYSGGGLRGLEDGTIDEKTGKPLGTSRAEGAILARWHKRISIIGMLYLSVGFVLQLVDHFI